MSKLVKTDDEWKSLLDQESYRVTRESGTEKPFTGKYWDFNDKGSYKCAVSYTHLTLPTILRV